MIKNKISKYLKTFFCHTPTYTWRAVEASVTECPAASNVSLAVLAPPAPRGAICRLQRHSRPAAANVSPLSPAVANHQCETSRLLMDVYKITRYKFS